MAPLSLPLSIALAAGALLAMWRPFDGPKRARLFAVGCMALLFAALVEIYVTVPHYSSVKSSYTLGLLPGYAVLAAAGLDLPLRRRASRALVVGYLCAWSLAAYAAFFVVAD